MQEFIDSIYNSLATENYHAAMFVSLSIPDICGSLETPTEKNGIRAKRWFSENLGYKYCPVNQYEALMAIDPERLKCRSEGEIRMFKENPFDPELKLDPATYWRLRNAFTHSASDWAGKTKVHLTHSESHMTYVNGALQISIVRFSHDMAEAATKWLDRMQDHPDVLERINATAKVQNLILNGTILFR